MNKAIKILFFLAFVLLLGGNISLAYDAIALPSNIKTGDPAVFMNSLYNWGISIVGILALFQFIISGIIYMTSGVVDQKKVATGRMTDALIGLGIALGAYLFLNIVNPTLLTLKAPTLETPTIEGYTVGIPVVNVDKQEVFSLDQKEALEKKGYTCTEEATGNMQTPFKYVCTGIGDTGSLICGNSNCGKCGSYYCGQNIGGYDATSCKWDIASSICVSATATTTSTTTDFSTLACNPTCWYQTHPDLISKDANGSNWTTTETEKLYTHDVALSKLQSSGITVTSSSGSISSNQTCTGCTSLNGMPKGIVDSVIAVKQSCSNCSFVITGGTEAGHQSQGFGKASIDAKYDETTYNYLLTNGQNEGLTIVREKQSNSDGSCDAGWSCFKQVTGTHMSIYKSSANVY